MMKIVCIWLLLLPLSCQVRCLDESFSEQERCLFEWIKDNYSRSCWSSLWGKWWLLKRKPHKNFMKISWKFSPACFWSVMWLARRSFPLRHFSDHHYPAYLPHSSPNGCDSYLYCCCISFVVIFVEQISTGLNAAGTYFCAPFVFLCTIPTKASVSHSTKKWKWKFNSIFLLEPQYCSTVRLWVLL